MARRILSKVFCCLPLFRKKRIVIKDKEVVILVQPEEQQNQPTETICEQPVPPTGNVVSQDNPEQIVGLGDNTFQEQTEDETGADIHQEPVHPTSNVVAQEPPEQNRQQTYIFDEEPEEFHGSNESEEEEDYDNNQEQTEDETGADIHQEPVHPTSNVVAQEPPEQNRQQTYIFDEEPEEFHGSNESEEEEDYDVQNNCIRRNINRSNEERISAKKESTPGRICYQPETWLLRYVPKRKGKGWKGLGTSGAKMHLLNAMNQLCSERSSSDNSQTLICLIFLDVYVLYMYIIFCLRKCKKYCYNKSFIKKRNKLQK
uniref:Uncharacterized protein n=1 Tax=Xenopus tropicalis TaxID=8364 RepID=A0A1B8XYB8_XENTR